MKSIFRSIKEIYFCREFIIGLFGFTIIFLAFGLLITEINDKQELEYNVHKLIEATLNENSDSGFVDIKELNKTIDKLENEYKDWRLNIDIVDFTREPVSSSKKIICKYNMGRGIQEVSIWSTYKGE